MLLTEFVSQISGLRNHDLAGVDSRREAWEATSGEARWPESSQRKPPYSIRDGSAGRVANAVEIPWRHAPGR